MTPILIVGVAAAGLLALASGATAKSKAPQKPGAQSSPPPDLAAAAKAAYEAADPVQLRAIAAKLEAAGFKAQADDFRAFAKQIESQVKAGVPAPPAPPPSSPQQTGVLVPSKGVTSPGWPQPSPTEGLPVITSRPAPAPLPTIPEIADAMPVDGQKLLAGKVALHLQNTSRGRENKTLVSTFQAANQPDAGKVDGLYGPKTALVFAKKYSIVPPKPFYWPRLNTTAVKRAYTTELMKLAMLDSARFDEWSAAAKV